MTQGPPAGGYGANATSNFQENDERSLGSFDLHETVTFWPRALARILDYGFVMGLAFVGAIVGSIALEILHQTGHIAPGYAERLNGSAAWGIVIGLFTGAGFHAIAEFVGGATPGKAVLGFRVCRVDGRRVGLLASLGRNFAYYIDSLFFAIPGYNAMKRSPLRQRIGDQWAGTLVVRRAALAARGTNAPTSTSRALVGLAVASLIYLAVSASELFIRGM